MNASVSESPHYQHPSVSPAARVRLINGQFADVIAGRYYPAGTSLILQDCKIVAMPGSQGELDTASVDDTSADVVIDLQGKYVVPGLFNDQPEHFMSYKPGASVMTAVQLEAAVDQARKHGIPTTIHNVTVEGFRQSLQAGVISLAHIPFDQELADADLKLFSDAETFVEPTLTVAYYLSWRMKGNSWRDNPEIERLDVLRDSTYQTIVEESWLPEVQKNYVAQPEALKEGTMKIFGLFEASQAFHYHAGLTPLGGKNFQRIYEAGGRERSGCGNDATVSSCSQASIHLEMEMFDFILNRNEERVFNGTDALRIATIQSARALGLDKQFGSIESGKTADLVILDGDPLEDFRLIGSRVAALFMDGKLVINNCGLSVESTG